MWNMYKCNTVTVCMSMISQEIVPLIAVDKWNQLQSG